MNELTVGLILAVVSGLAFVAYKHPTEYKKLAGILSVGASFTLLGIGVWNLAVTFCLVKLWQITGDQNLFVSETAKLKFISNIRNALEVDKVFSVSPVYVFLAVQVVIMILGALPLLGIVEKKTEDGPKPPQA